MLMSSSPNTTCTQFPLPSSSSPCFTRVYASFGRVNRSRIRRHRRNNKLKLSSPTTLTTTTTTSISFEPKLEAVIDLTHLQLFHSNIRQFIWSGKDAYRDLQNLFTLDDNRKLLVISCRPSTLHFVGTSTLVTLVVISVFRVLALLVSRFGYWRRNSSTYNTPMVRRDRSLGGKEVVVAMGPNRNTPVKASVQHSSKNNKVQFAKKLPKWWPTIVNPSTTLYDVDHNEQEEYKREASRVVRAIVDSRMAGKDISEHHIIQLRQLCRTPGVQVSVEPTNIRDSLYRASVNFVLNACSSAPTYSTSVYIYGEDAHQFLAGFAENIGIENVRAATIVSASVAARTRSCLLQAWALEMQGKHVDALAELSKICLLLQIFPPEESSPEMEMVSRGLEKHLKLEQRKHLMFLFDKVCSEGSHKIAREALGLVHSENYSADQLEDNII